MREGPHVATLLLTRKLSRLPYNIYGTQPTPPRNQTKRIVVPRRQVEALRTYLFTYSPHYESLSLQTLCEMFDMQKSKAHSIISKMMLSHELYGSWDQPTETVVLRKEDPNTLQLLALKFADKVQ